MTKQQVIKDFKRQNEIRSYYSQDNWTVIHMPIAYQFGATADQDTDVILKNLRVLLAHNGGLFEGVSEVNALRTLCLNKGITCPF